MLHWNSFWAPTGPDNQTLIETTPVLKEPWAADQLLALQARSWEQMITASQAWWSLVTAAWAAPAWALGSGGESQPSAANDSHAEPHTPRARPPAHSRTSASPTPRGTARTAAKHPPR